MFHLNLVKNEKLRKPNTKRDVTVRLLQSDACCLPAVTAPRPPRLL